MLKIFEEMEDFYIVMELFEEGDLEKVLEKLEYEEPGVTEDVI